MMNNTISTPITQYLDAQQVPYRLLPHLTPATTIEDAARQRGIKPNQMVKCILLRDMGDNLALACAPGDRNVDPKKVRALLNWRRMTCVDLASGNDHGLCARHRHTTVTQNPHADHF